MDRSIETFIQAGKQILRRFDGATAELIRRGGLLVLQCRSVVPTMLASSFCNVDLLFRLCWHLWMRIQREKLLISRLLTRRWSVNGIGRVEVEPPVAIEGLAPDEPTSDERRHHGLTHLPYQPWCNVCVRARGRENRHVSRSQNQPGTRVIPCDCCFVKTEEDAPMATVKRKETEIRLQVAVWPQSHDTSDIPK